VSSGLDHQEGPPLRPDTGTQQRLLLSGGVHGTGAANNDSGKGGLDAIRPPVTVCVGMSACQTGAVMQTSQVMPPVLHIQFPENAVPSRAPYPSPPQYHHGHAVSAAMHYPGTMGAITPCSTHKFHPTMAYSAQSALAVPVPHSGFWQHTWVAGDTLSGNSAPTLGSQGAEFSPNAFVGSSSSRTNFCAAGMMPPQPQAWQSQFRQEGFPPPAYHAHVPRYSGQGQPWPSHHMASYAQHSRPFTQSPTAHSGFPDGSSSFTSTPVAAYMPAYSTAVAAASYQTSLEQRTAPGHFGDVEGSSFTPRSMTRFGQQQQLFGRPKASTTRAMLPGVQLHQGAQ
jgi:hypothetical protein